LVVRASAARAVETTPTELTGRLLDVMAKMKATAEESSGRTWRWLGKRILQKLGVRRTGGAVINFTVNQPHLEPDLNLEMRQASRRILSAMLSELDWYAFLRRRNGQVWQHLFANGQSGERCRLSNDCRYLVAHAANSVDDARTFYQRLREVGVPVCSWPDLPPEVTARSAGNTVVRHLRETRVHFHVHQDLPLAAIARAADSGARGSVESCVELQWLGSEDAGWERLYATAIRANLLQSWEYGEAKASTSGGVARRGVFTVCGNVLAIMVAIQRWPGVCRVNRGPLFLRQPTPAELEGVLQALTRAFRGRVLSIAPNLEGNAENWLRLARCGYRTVKARPWVTVWQDLCLAETTSKAGMASNWRNRLNFADRAGLILDTDQGDDAFKWLVSRHQEAAEMNAYSSTPIEILNTLRRAGSMLVFRAKTAGIPVAGIGVARHGCSATYLIGWNGPDGRNLKANHFLLWHSSVWLRNSGVCAFDLGGIDEVNLPGITEFKLGMGGCRVEYVGEYVKI
jgi:hypothetical protein